MIIDNFFFLRPYWLLMLIPVIALIYYLFHRTRSVGRSAWHKLVDPHLLKYLTVTTETTGNSRLHIVILVAALFATVMALAGPAWQKNELPTFESHEPTVLVLSLTQSMNSTDISPSRIVRAGHKIRDILNVSKGGDFGFVIYADQPFVAVPLTSDASVITEMLPELSTNLMPVLGNQLDLAIGQAQLLLNQAGAKNGRIVILADDAGYQPAASIKAAGTAQSAGYMVNVLGVGTQEGADLQTASGQLIKSQNGATLRTSLAEVDLTKVSEAGGGKFVKLTPDNQDIDTLLSGAESFGRVAAGFKSEFQADNWNDMGYFLLFIPLFLAPIAFRKNVLMALPIGVLIAMSAPPPDANAAQWMDLWKTPDQQAVENFERGEFAAAAETFENWDWKATSLYKEGQYDRAAELYAGSDRPDTQYNLGNALAKAGKLEEALAAYDDALKRKPSDEDARFNRDLVAKLLEEQKQEKNQTQDQQQGGQQDQQQRTDPSAVRESESSGTTSDAAEPLQDGKSVFRKAMDAVLQGNGGKSEVDQSLAQDQPSAKHGFSELDQVREQQLRSVPDDPSGLLRARIRHHYARQRNNG